MLGDCDHVTCLQLMWKKFSKHIWKPLRMTWRVLRTNLKKKPQHQWTPCYKSNLKRRQSKKGRREGAWLLLMSLPQLLVLFFILWTSFQEEFVCCFYVVKTSGKITRKCVHHRHFLPDNASLTGRHNLLRSTILSSKIHVCGLWFSLFFF